MSCGTYVSLSPSLSDKVIRHRACSLKDTAHAIFASELDPEFDRMCDEIKEARKKRGKKREQSLMEKSFPQLKQDTDLSTKTLAPVSTVLCK